MAKKKKVKVASEQRKSLLDKMRGSYNKLAKSGALGAKAKVSATAKKKKKKGY